MFFPTGIFLPEIHSGTDKFETELYKTFFENKDTNFKHLVYHYSLMPGTDEKWKQEYELEKIDIIKEIMDEINKSKENGLQRI